MTTEPENDGKGAPMAAEDVSPEGPSGDLVENIVGQVRDELAERRRTGDLPDLPPGELGRQFDGVIEAVDGAVIDETPVGSAGLFETATLETWRSGGGIRNRVIGLVLWPLSRLLGALVRRQVAPFTIRAADILSEVVDRQNRMQRFLARAHLDRLRGVEYRIAALEQELEELRRQRDATR